MVVAPSLGEDPQSPILGELKVPLSHPSQGRRRRVLKPLQRLTTLSLHVLPALLLCFQAFTIMDQNRDGFIDKADLRDTFAALGEPPFRTLPSPTASTTLDLLSKKPGVSSHLTKPQWLTGSPILLNTSQSKITSVSQ